MRARFVVHAVGPIYDRKGPNPWSHEECDEKLRLTYLRALYKADEVGVQHLAFCLLSAGVFRGRRRLEDVLAIGMNAVIAALGQCKSLNEVHLVGYNPNEISILKSLAESVARGEPIAPSPSTTTDISMGASSTKERTAEGHRTVTVATGNIASAPPPSEPAEPRGAQMGSEGNELELLNSLHQIQIALNNLRDSNGKLIVSCEKDSVNVVEQKLVRYFQEKYGHI